MVLDRRTALPGVLLLLTLAGCGGSHNTTAQQPSTSTASSSATTQPASTQSASTPLVPTQPASTTPRSSAPRASSSVVVLPPSKTVSIPAHLCSGMDAAQNAADAYLGALGAGNLAEALACVRPNTVPEALTRSLLAKGNSTAAYLPRDGVDGPTVFGYRGNGKLIDVTVGKQVDGQFRVTKVVVRSG